MKRTLIFDPAISGHHLEYLNHLYHRAGTLPEQEFVFALHHEFRRYHDFLRWPEFMNTKIILLSESELTRIDSGKLASAFRKNRLLRSCVKKVRPTHLFLVSLMHFLPFLPLFISSKVRVSGIIYNIFCRDKSRRTPFRRLADFSKYLLMSKTGSLENVYLLNDCASARLMNRILATEKFRYVPDPVIMVPSAEKSESRRLLSVDSQKKVLLHFGSLEQRKGTIDILDAIEGTDKKLTADLILIFAGYLNSDIRSEFLARSKRLSGSVDIRIYEGFCRYELLGQLCSASDFLVMPYRRVSNSSGLLGFAAQFNLPVIVPSSGLLGSLVRKYRLGYSYEAEKQGALRRAICDCLCGKQGTIDGREYLVDNSIMNFQRIVLV